MNKVLKIRCENNNSEVAVKTGTTLLELLQILNISSPNGFIAAYVNNKSKDLNYVLYENKSVRFLEPTHFEGSRVYSRTLFFVLYKTVKDLFKDAELKIRHSVSRGVYFTIDGVEPSAEIAKKIKNRMSEIVHLDLPISRDRVCLDEAKEIYQREKMLDKMKMLDSKPHLYVTINQMADVFGYFYGTLAPSSASVPVFDVQEFYEGFYLLMPLRYNVDVLERIECKENLFDVFSKYKQWVEIMDVSNVGSLNSMVLSGRSSEMVKVGEALQEKIFSRMADTVLVKHRDGVRLVLISGPSSSGKTTFSSRLMIQLKVLGLSPVILSMDNYFVNREDTPLDENGKHDFESLGALDVPLFNDHLKRLIDGEAVEIPKFDFYYGKRKYDGTTLKLSEHSLLIVEGIHGLNPELTVDIPGDKKYKIYVSALTSVSMDNLSRISTTDNRLLRRIVRDFKYRNHTAEQTINRWGSVRRGEEKNVFPYQEESDIMFNSALFFEVPMLKRYAEPLLLSVPDTVPEYSEACRLLTILDFFVPIDDSELPPTSIIREFIGGSSFEY